MCGVEFYHSLILSLREEVIVNARTHSSRSVEFYDSLILSLREEVNVNARTLRSSSSILENVLGLIFSHNASGQAVETVTSHRYTVFLKSVRM